MSNFGTYLISASPGPVATALSVRRRSQGGGLHVEEWPTVDGWSAAFSVEPLAEDFQAVANELAAELGGPAAVGWSDNGMVFCGSLSTDTAGGLPLGFNLSGDDLYEDQLMHPARGFLVQRWGTDWATAASPHITGWLDRITPGVDERKVLELLNEPFGDA